MARVNRYECGHIKFVACGQVGWFGYNLVMLFSVIARDASDPEAPARRAAAREQHLAEIRPHAESGVLQLGGAFVDQDGVMRGSIMLLDLPDRAAVEAHLQADIYWRSGVWREFEISEFKRAV